jgi:NAD(P)-dependent dehydrogenase (short-subunit alcohol dehydrogenase family)
VDAFKGRTAIVTGGASAIGRALGEELGRRGSSVILADLNEALLEEVVGSLAGEGYAVKGAALDVTDSEAVRKLVEDTVREHGRLDFMFNNAGIGVLGEALDFSIDDWRKVIDVNLFGVVHGVAAAYPVMAGQGYGHIVNTASLAGLVPIPGIISYAASKYGVVGLSEVLRVEGKKYGVRVSVVCPGLVKTPIYANLAVVGIERSVVQGIGPRGVPVRKCVRTILRGVERNRGIIAVSVSAKALWAIQRLSPGLANPVNRLMAAAFRAIKNRANS